MCINSINSRYFDFIILTLVKKILYLGYTTSIHSSMEILGHSNETREIILMLTMGFPLNAYVSSAFYNWSVLWIQRTSHFFTPLRVWIHLNCKKIRPLHACKMYHYLAKRSWIIQGGAIEARNLNANLHSITRSGSLLLFDKCLVCTQSPILRIHTFSFVFSV